MKNWLASDSDGGSVNDFGAFEKQAFEGDAGFLRLQL